MYSAYFDESGHPDDSKYVVVGGGVAQVEQWVHLEREWKDALSPLGTSIFHATDFDQGTRPFDGLDNKGKSDLLEQLVNIIIRRLEICSAVAVPMGQYKVVDGKYVFSDLFGYPYPLAARHCIAAVEEWAHKHEINVFEILFFFEDGAKHKGQLEWIAERDKATQPVFRKKSEVIALQVGDLIAWCVNLRLTNGEAIHARYLRALEKLGPLFGRTAELNLDDPDRIPTLLNIPLRDPTRKYKYRIIKKGGRRHAIVHSWPKAEAPARFDRTRDVLPETNNLSIPDLERAAKEYDLARKKSV
jgi:hypothetical protein